MKLDNTTIREAVALWFEDQNACIQTFGHISNWDTSEVTMMRSLFCNRESFNEDISKWNVSSVIDMSYMFVSESFNQDIGNWDVSKVTDMSGMFVCAKSFNQDIGKWNVSKVRKMYSMFLNAKSFNQDISSWKIRNDSKIAERMFEGAELYLKNFYSKTRIRREVPSKFMKFNNDSIKEAIKVWLED